jgi:hypothetical protein
MNTYRIKISVLAFSFIYAIVRYHFFADIEWAHFPLFVMNKALSFAGLVFLGCSLLQGNSESRKNFGFISVVLITVHIAISLMILNKNYFVRFFLTDGTLTLQSEVSMLAGVLGAIMMIGLVIASGKPTGKSPSSLKFGWGRSILVLSAVHVAFMGYVTWYPPSDWYGYMPPITLLSFIVSLGFIVKKSIGTSS